MNRSFADIILLQRVIGNVVLGGYAVAQGPVLLDVDSTVHGDVLAGGTVVQQPQSTVTGTVTANATVPLPCSLPAPASPHGHIIAGQ
jgi:hypothetical protein